MKRENDIRLELLEMESPLADFPREMPHAVPESYFGQLPAHILSRAKASPVPDGYFEALPDAMLQAAKTAHVRTDLPRQKVRIIQLPAIRQAAAAAVVVGLALGSFAFFQNSQSPERAIARLPKEDVGAYVEAHLDEIDPELLTTEVLAALNNSGPSGTTDEELEAYLDETGWRE